MRDLNPMPNQCVTRCTAAVLIILLFVVSSSTTSSSKPLQSPLTPDDENAIKATIEAYRATWLANDAKGVLKTFTDGAVLLPAHGTPPVVGIAAIDKYWFSPGGPATTIVGTRYHRRSGQWGRYACLCARAGSRCVDRYRGGNDAPPFALWNLSQRHEEDAGRLVANTSPYVG